MLGAPDHSGAIPMHRLRSSRIAKGLAAAAAMAGSVSARADDVSLSAGANKVSVRKPTRSGPGCRQLFTPKMGERAALRVYVGTRIVARRALRTLGYIERCQRDPHDQARVRAFDHRQRMAWWARRHPPPTNTSVASWYDDAGATASGWHATYGVANLSYGFGTKVLICYPWNSSRCVTATVDDRGPYVGGRDWDLNQNVAGALGFSGVDTVGWRIVN
jgi:rare lipoprotein A (peptidoglycan hydrolase)